MRKIDKLFRWGTACFFRSSWNPIETCKLADGLFVLRVGIVNMFIYKDKNNTIAIDASYETPELIDEFKKINIDPLSITHLFLTHSDIDHAGSYGIFKNAQVYLGKEEKQMIDGSTARIAGIYLNPEILNTCNFLSDSDEIAAGNISIRAISTPGHTPGSMCYLIDESLLFTGDTLILKGEKVFPFYNSFNMNTEQQKLSIKKLSALEKVSAIYTAHTGYSQDFKTAFE